LKYNNNDKIIWVIDTLPMDQYVWGMGETTGTGPFEHTKVMTTMFRTYGYWYREYATKYLKYGFAIRSDSGSQIYLGYDWEKKYPNIKKAADATKGIIAKYKNEVALTPYSSWSDGRTRSFEERWGSDDYPWCKSVKDPYGKHPSMNTKQLEAAGNHMVGLIANGSVKLAGDKYKKKYDWILKYYYTKITLAKMY
jgi:SpoIID/LytB domain protein